MISPFSMFDANFEHRPTIGQICLYDGVSRCKKKRKKSANSIWMSNVFSSPAWKPTLVETSSKERPEREFTVRTFSLQIGERLVHSRVEANVVTRSNYGTVKSNL